MTPETRLRNHLHSFSGDSSISEFSDLSQNTVGFLSGRGARTNKHLKDNRTESPLPSAFMKSINESSYLSIMSKVMAKYSVFFLPPQEPGSSCLYDWLPKSKKEGLVWIPAATTEWQPKFMWGSYEQTLPRSHVVVVSRKYTGISLCRWKVPAPKLQNYFHFTSSAKLHNSQISRKQIVLHSKPEKWGKHRLRTWNVPNSWLQEIFLKGALPFTTQLSCCCMMDYSWTSIFLWH